MSEEKQKPKIGGIGQQRNQYRTIGSQPTSPQTSEHQERRDTQEEPQNNNTALSQNNNVTKQENSNTAKRQYSTKTQERDKVTYYLEPGQFDKLEEIRLAYKKATGTRLNEQELMRLIIDRLHLDFLL